MNKVLTALLVACVLCGAAVAAPLGTNARTVLPAQIQQILSVDYRALRNSSSGLALKASVLPDNLKAFERSLHSMGVDPDSDLEQLTFVSYRIQERGAKGQSFMAVRTFGVATGNFETKQIIARFKAKKVRAVKYHDDWLWPADNGFNIVFLDDSTMLFGEPNAVKDALNVRNGDQPGVGSSPAMAQSIADAQSAPVWSVLDQQGTQNMLRNVLGEASALADYDSIKKRLLSSRYSLDMQNGVDFGLDVDTSDSFTAGTLSALLNAGVLYKKAAGSAAEKSAMQDINVSSDSSRLQLNFKADDSQFQALLKSDLFQAVAR